jgi:hypothetical protein
LKKTIPVIVCTVAAFAVSLASAQTPASSPSPASRNTTSGPQVRALLDQYCVGCHNQRLKTADLTLDKLDPSHVEADPEKWEKVVHKLRAGMMPPSGMPRPTAATREITLEWLENQLDTHVVAKLPPPGLHRLNRTEYQNAIRDLIAVDIDPSKYLPSDDSTRGFDNVAAALSLSPALLEGYTSAAAKISRIAIGDVKEASATTYRVPSDTSQDYHIDGLPFGTRGGMLIKHTFPADGDYVFKIFPINKGLMDNNSAFGDIPGEKMELIVDGERVKLYDWDAEVARGSAIHNGTADVHVQVKAGPHTVGVTFLATQLAPSSDLNEHFLRSTIETGGLPGFRFYPHVGKVDILGPYKAVEASDSPSRRKIFICTPAGAAQEANCAKQIVANLARHAYRRPVTDQDTEMLMGFYQQGRNNGGAFDQGIEMALQRVLADPEFVFRKETEPSTLKPGQKYRISDLELASRLSFFIWSSVPDDELLTLAGQNKLRDPAVLDKEVRRMLADPRSDQLVLNFAGQWLNLRGMQSVQPVTSLYPDFDDNLRLAMRKETELFVDSIVHEDRPVTDLLDANYTFLNERLARHYGIPSVYGSNFRRVDLTPEFDMRRGLLGKGSILTISSQPQRTSPVGRGKTIMQMFLGVSPPDPPPNVKIEFAVNEAGRGPVPSMRQQMESHRKNEPCMSCHKIMDPIGFSLENFDAIGQWRTLDGTAPVDASGLLVDGTKMDGVAGLRNALKNYSPEFVRVITEKLMIYALGRGTEYYDMPLMRSVIHDAARNNYRFSGLVLGIVKSEPFQWNQIPLDSGSRAALKPVVATKSSKM